MSITFRDWIIDQQERAFTCPRCRVEMRDPDEADACEDLCCPCALMADEWRREHGDEPPTPLDARAPDHTRSGIFADHNCWECRDGTKKCANGNPIGCEFPRARND